MKKGNYFSLVFMILFTVVFLIAPFSSASDIETIHELMEPVLISAPSPGEMEVESNIMSNVLADFNKEVESPSIDSTAYVHPLASVKSGSSGN